MRIHSHLRGLPSRGIEARGVPPILASPGRSMDYPAPVTDPSCPPERRPQMNWQLIVQLSLFGLVMALATVFVVPSNAEPLLWLLIFVICAYLIAKRAP